MSYLTMATIYVLMIAALIGSLTLLQTRLASAIRAGRRLLSEIRLLFAEISAYKKNPKVFHVKFCLTAQAEIQNVFHAKSRLTI